jgi:hypothetical protein
MEVSRITHAEEKLKIIWNGVNLKHDRQKYKKRLANLSIYYFCGSVWAWTLVSEIKERIQTEGVGQKRADEIIWTEEGWSDGRVKMG